MAVAVRVVMLLNMATFHVANHTKLLNKIKRFTVENVKLSDDAEHLKLEVAKKLNTTAAGIELIYCGRCLKEGRSLESHNVKAGVTIHVLDKVLQTKTQPPKVPVKKLDPAEIQQLVLALRTAIMNPAYRETVQRLSKPDVLENIIAATPGLAEDPVAIAILQDPDLLLHLTDINSINRVVEAHPALADAVNHIVAAVHEEAGSSSGNTAQMLSSYLYSLDALSDDDDEVDSSSQTEPGSSSSASSLQPDFSQLSFAGITQAQLASALASAVAGTSSLSSAMTGSQLSHQSRAHASSDSAITPELFQQAVHQALNAQLQQLRDMGINDDALSIRALEMTGGDVHAALELIFGDFMSNNSGGGAAPSQ